MTAPDIIDASPGVAIISWVDPLLGKLYEAKRNAIEPRKWNLIEIDLLRSPDDRLPYRAVVNHPLTLAELYAVMNEEKLGP